MAMILSMVLLIVGLGLAVDGLIRHHWMVTFWALVVAVAGAFVFVNEYKNRP